MFAEFIVRRRSHSHTTTMVAGAVVGLTAVAGFAAAQSWPASAEWFCQTGDSISIQCADGGLYHLSPLAIRSREDGECVLEIAAARDCEPENFQSAESDRPCAFIDQNGNSVPDPDETIVEVSPPPPAAGALSAGRFRLPRGLVSVNFVARPEATGDAAQSSADLPTIVRRIIFRNGGPTPPSAAKTVGRRVPFATK